MGEGSVALNTEIREAEDEGRGRERRGRGFPTGKEEGLQGGCEDV